MIRRPIQRAFSGLVGLPPEPEEAVVAPAHTPVAAQEPSVSETAPAPPSSKPAVSERLASLAYRPRRDPTTGKVIDHGPPQEAAGFDLVLEATRMAPAASRSKTPVSPRFPSMRQTLMLDAEDLIALFDATSATKVGEREEFGEMDFRVPAQMLQHRIKRLKKLIAASTVVVDGLSVRVMKVRRGKDEVVDKATREKFKREESARIARCNAKLFRYHASLRDGNYKEKLWRYQMQPVYFRDLVSDTMTFQDFGDFKYIEGREVRVDGLVTHRTTDMVREYTESRTFDLSRYEVVMRLDDNALRLLGESEDQQKRSWAYWQRWENAVIKAGVFHGVLRPRQDLLDLLGLMPFVQAALAATESEVEADETENALALKTSGACYGGGIRSGGVRYSKQGFRQRSLESFDKEAPLKDDSGGTSGYDSGFANLREINDDAESYQPD